MVDRYVVFKAKQGEELRYGYFVIKGEISPLTDEVVMQAIAQTAGLKVGEVIEAGWKELTKDEYEERRGEDIRELGPSDLSNVDQKQKMN